ncbi:hypothetical protein [Bradyrhizobium jicamae]|uniref:hypothetical protein n=1 Tax=Bradyrhizobium jicamae TaxID=280332 RepID=UPI002011A244|nr:hypothetical protein [Bradyrhizobium jicamae]
MKQAIKLKSLASWMVSLASLIWTSASFAETVDVKYRGAVDLKPFVCTDSSRSSFIQRVCYDKAHSYAYQSSRHVLPLLRTAAGHARCIHRGSLDGSIL